MKLRIARKVVRLSHEGRHRKVTVDKAFARVDNEESVRWLTAQLNREISNGKSLKQVKAELAVDMTESLRAPGTIVHVETPKLEFIRLNITLSPGG